MPSSKPWLPVCQSSPPPEAVTDQISGLLVAEGDAPALARRTLQLLADPARYQNMTRAAREEVARKFERSAQTATLESFYDEAATVNVLHLQARRWKS